MQHSASNPSRRTGAARGFTLIEVTLAIVIGIILIAGATLIYNQAKQAAGNARAQEKVAALGAVVEQWMAADSGIPPDINDLRALWQRDRPDDYGSSPWGGVASPTTDQNDPTGNGACSGASTTPSNGILWGNCLSPDSGEIAAGGTYVLTCTTGTSGCPVPAPSPAWSGSLIYYNFNQTAGSATTFQIWDESKRSLVQVNNYGVASTNWNGTRWYFVHGGSTGAGENGGIGAAGGCVGC